MLVAENYTFKFYHNAETRLYVEGANEKADSIFRNVYGSFFKELESQLLERKKDGSNKRVGELQDNLNNIFAFIGERGTGKTSCMLSVAKMLEENTETSVVDRGRTSFKVLDSTDPSFFDETTNILDIFLGHLFNDFKEKWEKSNQDNINEKNDLLESFEKVKQTISCMDFKKRSKSNCISSEDNVDRLLDLGASVNLAKDIQNLIQQYLKFFDRDVLVIPVDDIDLHSSCAYEMVEQIRKYLTQKNVIVLMALKMEQLQKVVERSFLHEFHDLINQKLLSCEQISEMANKYLIKLIPENHRFNLPTIDLMYNRLASIYEKCRDNASQEKSDNFLNQKWLINESLSGYPVRYIIVKLIFSKTRYLFYHMQGATSFIIPHTLREYNQLLELLLEMPDYEKGVLTEQNQHNKDVFRQYFIQSWCKSNLNENDGLFIKYLFSIEDPSIVNKIVVQKLHSRFPNELNEKSEEVKKILDEKNRSYNISVGDVNLLLRQIKGALVQFSDKAFIFAIETFYSMRLYEYYDYRTELSREIGDDEDQKRTKKSIEKIVRVKNEIDEYSTYEILAGGSFFNLNGENGVFIPLNKEERRRDYRIYSLTAMKKILDPLLSKKELSEEEIKIFRLCELFVLLTLRQHYKRGEKNTINSNDYRANKDIVYATKFNTDQDFVWFDVMAFFTNLPNVKRCYNRIDERLFAKAEGNKNSLYNSLLAYCKENRGHARNGEVHPLLSYSSIRNIEILNDLYNYISENYSINGNLQDDRESLIDFFKMINKYFIKSYDEKSETKADQKEWNDIDYHFVTVFINVLEDDDTKGLFDTIFGSGIDLEKQKVIDSVRDSLENGSENEVNIWNIIVNGLDKIKSGKLNSEEIVKIVFDVFSLIAKNENNKRKKITANDAKSEKKTEQDIDLSKLSNELRGLFNEDEKFYDSDYVKSEIRDLLRKKGILDDNVTSWISKNYVGPFSKVTYNVISKYIEKFITYMRNRKAHT